MKIQTQVYWKSWRPNEWLFDFVRHKECGCFFVWFFFCFIGVYFQGHDKEIEENKFYCNDPNCDGSACFTGGVSKDGK